jgi:hypothetical protein
LTVDEDELRTVYTEVGRWEAGDLRDGQPAPLWRQESLDVTWDLADQALRRATLLLQTSEEGWLKAAQVLVECESLAADWDQLAVAHLCQVILARWKADPKYPNREDLRRRVEMLGNLCEAEDYLRLRG